MNKQLLFLSLAAAALFAGCARNEIDGGGQTASATHISAKANGQSDIALDTKAPVTGSSMNGLTADVYASTYSLSGHTGDIMTTFSQVYAYGTMTFDDAQYVIFDKAGFGGKDGGNSILPQDGREVYLYGFYPQGWERKTAQGGSAEALCYTFDGKTDVMSTWLDATQDLKIKYNDAPKPDKADFIFKHLLTRYNIQIKASDADALKEWGRVKSIEFARGAEINNVHYVTSTAGNPLEISFATDPNVTTPTAFYQLKGADVMSPVYSEDRFEQADYTTSQPLTTAYQNACYSMVVPVTVDATSAAEVTLVVKTVNAAGKEITANVPVTLDQTKFTSNGNSTRGFSITLAFNFRVGVIQATAIVEEWKDYGIKYEEVDLPKPPPTVGDYYYADGSYSKALTAGKTAIGMVYYVDPADPQKYKVMSLEQTPTQLAWAASTSYIVAAARSDADGKANSAAVRDYFTANSGTVGSDYSVAFPAFNYCYNYKGKSGSDALGTWYLPAKSELQYLWCAYNGKVPVTWSSSTSSAAPADAAKQGAWNDRIKAAGIAAGITSINFWSSTEDSGNASSAWVVYFSDGDTDNTGKSSTGYVRCVRDVVSPPPPPPAAGDYYYADGTFATELTADKTATGMVYYVDPADPKKYKVMSLEEAPTKLAWAKEKTYVVAAARSNADGKANSAAVRDYFTANSGTVGSDYSVAFPAFNYCYNYKGKSGSDAVGTWYLPAKSESQYLWCAYNGKAPVTWDGGGSLSAMDVAKQTAWNDRIKAAGIAAGITKGNFWSSTEDSNNASNAWEVCFSYGDADDGYTYSIDKSATDYVRCVRDN